MHIKHLQSKMLLFILLPMVAMLAVIIVLNYWNTTAIYTNQLEANMKKKLQLYTNDFNGFLLEKSQVAKDLALFSQTKELITTAKYPKEDRQNDPLFMTVINDFLKLRTADRDKAILQIFMGLEATDEAYYDDWKKRKGTEIKTIPTENFQKDIMAKLTEEKDKAMVNASYVMAGDKTAYRLKDGVGMEARSQLLDIFRRINFGYHVKGRSWYQDVLSRNEFCFSSAYIDTSLLIPVVSAMMPVQDKDNKMIGAVGADISLEYLTEKLKDLKIEGIDSNYTFLVDNRGYYIAYAYPENENLYLEKIDVEDKQPELVNKIQKEKTTFLKYADQFKNEGLRKIGNDIGYVSDKMLSLANLGDRQIKEYNLQNYLTLIKNIYQEKASTDDCADLAAILNRIPKTISDSNQYMRIINAIYQRPIGGASASAQTSPAAQASPQDYATIKNYLAKINDSFLESQQIKLKNSLISQIDASQKFEALEDLYPKLIALGHQYELVTDLTHDELILINDVASAINENKTFKFKDAAQYAAMANIASHYAKISIPDLETVSFINPKMKNTTIEAHYRTNPEDYFLIFMPIPSVKWSIGLYVSKSQALKPVNEILRLSLILGSIAIVILILVILVLKNIILKPIQALAQGMQQIESVNFNAKVQVQTQDEIGQMTNIYNSMLDGLLERDTKLNYLISVSRTIATETELQSLLVLIMNNSTTLLEADVGTIFLYDEKRLRLVNAFSTGGSAIALADNQADSGSGIALRCAESGQLVNIPQAFDSELFDPASDAASGLVTRNILCMPITTTTGETIGVVELKNKKGGKAFDENDEKLLSAFTSLAGISIQNARTLKEIKATLHTFQLFVPPKFLERIAKEGIGSIKVGNATQETISVLFSDIRNFTGMSEQLSPEGVFTFLNEYMEEMNICIKSNDGFIDKFIGDAIMALFDRKHSDGAVRAAIDMHNRLRVYNKKRLIRGDKPIIIGCGVNTGPAIIGTLGSSERMDGTVIGDCVNLANRLESLTKIYGSSILISSFTKDALEHPEAFLIREVDAVKVKGKEEIVTIYEVFDADGNDLIEGKLKTRPMLGQAIALYRRQEWAQAMVLFKECASLVANDKVPLHFLNRIEQQQIAAPQDGWDGATRHHSAE